MTTGPVGLEPAPRMLLWFVALGAFLSNQGCHGKTRLAAPSNIANVSLVVARYNEPINEIDWIRDYPHVLYNRGRALYDHKPWNDSLPLNIVDLTQYANCGRESYIYLSHIIHNYHQLANLNIFSTAYQEITHTKVYTNKNFQEDVQNLASGKIFLTPANDGFINLVPTCIPLLPYLGNKVHLYNKKYGLDRFDVLWDGFEKLCNFTVVTQRERGGGGKRERQRGREREEGE